MFNNLFDKFGQNININPEDVNTMAAAASQMDLADAEQVRLLVRGVAGMVGRPLAPEVEEQLIGLILSGNVPKDMGALMKMMK
ncbi:MAG: stage VI sporulation protein F [Turicibacter sp.]|nr:stage VI sporulation protein F [Turicibacter sp.]